MPRFPYAPIARRSCSVRRIGSAPVWPSGLRPSACGRAMSKAKVSGAAAVLAASAFAFAPSASATIVTVTYSGAVTMDLDLTGIFGTPQGINNLIGEKYVSRFVFDTSQGMSESNGNINEIVGGAVEGVSSPVLSATVTVGSTTVSIAPPYFDGEIFSEQRNDGNQGTVLDFAQDSDIFNYNIYSDSKLFGPVGAFPYSLDQQFTYDAAVSGGYGEQEYYNRGNKVGQAFQYTDVQADVSTLTVSTGISESSTWTMMLAGSAGLGLAGYRKRKSGSIGPRSR
jgi:hypothetical protein